MSVTPLQFNAEGNLIEYLNKLEKEYIAAGKAAEDLNDIGKTQVDIANAQAEAMGKFDKFMGGATEEEKQLAQAIIKAREEMAAQKAMAEAMGVPLADVQRGIKKVSDEQKRMEHTVGGIDVSKKSMRDYGDVLEVTTGLQVSHMGAIAETVATMGPFAIGAIAAGKAIEWWNEKEAEADKIAATFSQEVVKQAGELEKLRAKHIQLTEAQEGWIRKGEEYKQQNNAEEITKTKDAIEQTERKMALLSGEMGLQFGPLSALTNLWHDAGEEFATAAKRMQELEDRLKMLKEGEAASALKAQQAADFAAQQAVLTGKEKMEQEHLNRVSALRDNFAKSGDINYARSLQLENARYQHELAEFSNHQGKKTQTLAQANAAREAQEAQSAERMRQKHEQIIAKEKQLVAQWNNQARADREAENQRLIAEYDRTEQRKQAVLMRGQQWHRRTRAQELREQLAAYRKDLKNFELTELQKRQVAKDTAEFERQIRAAEFQSKAQIAMESSAALTRAFGANKDAAKVEAGINLFKGITQIWGQWGAYPPVAAALTVIHSLITKKAIDDIDGQKAPQGQFHGGGVIPRTGTYVMEGGEVTLPNTDAQRAVSDHIKNISNRMDAERRGGGGGAVHNHYHGTVFDKARADREMARGSARGRRRSNVRAA